MPIAQGRGRRRAPDVGRDALSTRPVRTAREGGHPVRGRHDGQHERRHQRRAGRHRRRHDTHRRWRDRRRGLRPGRGQGLSADGVRRADRQAVQRPAGDHRRPRRRADRHRRAGREGRRRRPESYEAAVARPTRAPASAGATGARRMLVLVADNVPHDSDLNEGIPEDERTQPSPFNTRSSPEGYDWQATLDAAREHGLPVLMVFFHGAGDYLPYWAYWAGRTAGAATDGNISDLEDTIVSLVEDEADDTLPPWHARRRARRAPAAAARPPPTPDRARRHPRPRRPIARPGTPEAAEVQLQAHADRLRALHAAVPPRARQGEGVARRQEGQAPDCAVLVALGDSVTAGHNRDTARRPRHRLPGQEVRLPAEDHGPLRQAQGPQEGVRRRGLRELRDLGLRHGAGALRQQRGHQRGARRRRRRVRRRAQGPPRQAADRARQGGAEGAPARQTSSSCRPASTTPTGCSCWPAWRWTSCRWPSWRRRARSSSTSSSPPSARS